MLLFILEMVMFYVYILQSATSGQFYIGQTNDLNLRIKRHNNNRVTAIKNRGLWKLIYSERFETRSVAMKREKYLKSRKSRIAIQQLTAQSPESRLGRD